MSIPVSRLALSDQNGSDDQSSLGFGTFRTPNASRPTLVELSVLVDATGGTEGRVSIGVDESGGTTTDYSYILRAAPGNGEKSEGASVYVPAGGSYILTNSSDPTGNNAILVLREWSQ